MTIAGRVRKNSPHPPLADHGRFHQAIGLLTTIARKSTFRNKIPETPQPRRLCNDMKGLIPDHEYKLHLGGIAKPGIQKTLDCRSDVRNLCGRS